MAKTAKKKKAVKVPASKKAVKTGKTKTAKAKSGKSVKKKKKSAVETAGTGTVVTASRSKKRGQGNFQLAEAVVKGLQEKKGKNIVWLNLSGIEHAVADHFIICEAESTIQVDALGRSVEEVVKQDIGEKPWHSEGKQNAQWILIDYVSVVVHIFQTEMRGFYNLEALWADAEVMEVALQD